MSTLRIPIFSTQGFVDVAQVNETPAKHNMRTVLTNYFIQHPHAVLDLEQIKDKWGCTERQAQEAISFLRKQGRIKQTVHIRAIPEEIV